MSRCLYRLHPPGVSGEPFEERGVFPVGLQRLGERLFPFNVTYFSASLAIFIGLVFLGIAVSRADVLPVHWRTLPLILGLSALLPVWILAFIHLEVPVVVLGAAWMLLGYVLWSERGASARQPAHVR